LGQQEQKMRILELLSERCWKGYKQVGGKKKGGRMVPNCVPVEETRRNPTELFKPNDSELDELHHRYIAAWTMLDHHILEKTYVFADDDTAEQFIDRVNNFSESMDHNAVITQDNAEVKLQITTNDVKGLTILDFEFALRSDDAADKLDGQSKSHPTNALNENQEKYILYLDDKPVSVYPSSREANNQAKMVAQKYPSARITVKKEVCTLTPVQLAENLRDWFGKGKQGGAGGGGWDRYNAKGKRIGKCGDRKPGEGKPKCLSKSKAAALRAKGGKKAIAAAVRRKRAKDTNPERKGSAINVSNKI
jgi:pterin-4a-carbinolamine dehydratase